MPPTTAAAAVEYRGLGECKRQSVTFRQAVRYRIFNVLSELYSSELRDRFYFVLHNKVTC